MKFILLVDDDETIREVLAETLKDGGATVIEAGDVAEGKSQLASLKFDAAVFDYELPDGDSVELVKKARKSHPDTKIIVASGRPDLAKHSALKAGADLFLSKPLDLPKLLEPLREWGIIGNH